MACANWYDRDAEELVESVTGLSEGDHFDRCIEFAISNLNYHTYLDVNSHKVTRSIEGLYEKFLIHSQNSKAEQFRSLCSTFLSRTVFKDDSTRDVQFSLLALLFELANNPTKSDYEKLKLTLKRKEQEVPLKFAESVDDSDDDFHIPPQYDHASDWSDDDLSDESKDVAGKQTTKTSKNEESTASPGVGLRVQPVVAANAGENGASGRAWLSQHLQVPYWSNISSNEASQSQSSSLSANLRRQWERYVSSCMPIIHFSDTIELSERQVTREILWMLEGREQTFLFPMGSDGVPRVNPKIAVSHVTKNTLSNVLQPLANIGGALFNLRRFVERTTTFVTTDTWIQTYNAFAVALFDWLHLFTVFVGNLERIIIVQKVTLTLSMTIEQLEPWFSSLDMIVAVYEAGIESVTESQPAWFKASHLLNVLYSAVEQIDGTGEAVRDEAALITAIFLKTVRPYLSIIDTWMTVGYLQDPSEEFIVLRNKDVTSLDEKFWDTSIVIREHHFKQSEVLFLKPVLKTIILIGKSMELLHCLGKLLEVTQHMGQESCRSLSTTFLERFKTLLGKEGLKSRESSLDSIIEDDSYSSVTSNKLHLKDILESEDFYDPIISKLMMEHFVEEPVEDNIQISEEMTLEQLIELVKSSETHTITAAINGAIAPEIEEKYRYVCPKLIDILKSHYHLEEYLLSMRKYLLMEKGDVLFHFYSQLFEKIHPGKLTDEEEMNLNIIWEDALFIYCPEDVSKMTISIDKTVNPKIVNKIDSYKPISLVYNLSWPLDIIINAACRERYAKIFAFLLQIKRAKYCLDELRFYELSTPVSTSRRHSCSSQLFDEHSRMIIDTVHLFRVKLLHFVNTLHSHLMARILHNSESVLQKLLNSSSSDLQLVIAAHEEYIKNIFEQSLLHPKVAVLKDSIVKILNLALVFADLWNSGADKLSRQMIKNMDEDITNCHKFLRSFIRHLAPKGNLNYLENMVEALADQQEPSFRFL